MHICAQNEENVKDKELSAMTTDQCSLYKIQIPLYRGYCGRVFVILNICVYVHIRITYDSAQLQETKLYTFPFCTSNMNTI